MSRYTNKAKEMSGKFLPIYNKYKGFTYQAQARKAYKEIKPDMTFDHFRHIYTEFVKLQETGQSYEVDLDFNVDFDIELPETFYQEPNVYTVPSGYTRALVLCDIHIPFHDINSIKTALKYGYEKGIDTIILNGDIIDFPSQSRHEKNFEFRNTQMEIDAVRFFLDNLRNKFKDAKIIYKIGNHDSWLTRRLGETNINIQRLDDIQLESLLRLNNLDIDTVQENDRIKLGKLNILHGHEFKRGGVHVAWNILLKTFSNVLFGHFHRTQERIIPTIENEYLGGWSVGCLCGTRPSYMPYGLSNQGFAFVEVEDKEGNFRVENNKIINGMVL